MLYLMLVDNPKSIDFLDTVVKERLNYDSGDTKAFCKSDKTKWICREVIVDKGIWTVKKRYILNVHDSEGVRYKTKLKMMGIETVKSSTMW